MKPRPRLADLFSVDTETETDPTAAAAPPPPCPNGDGGGTSAGTSIHGGSQHGSQHGARQMQHLSQQNGSSSPFQRQPGSLPASKTLKKSRSLSAGRTSGPIAPTQPTLADLMRQSFSRAGSLDSEGVGSSVAEPRPTLEYSGKPHARLVKRCTEAIEALERLQRPIVCMQSGGERKPPLPTVALKFAMVRAWCAHACIGSRRRMGSRLVSCCCVCSELV